MPNTVDQFTTAAACYNLFNPMEKLAARIYFKLANAVATSAVATNDVDTLALAATCFRFSPPLNDSISVVIAAQNAVAAGSTVSATDVDAVKTAIACLKGRDLGLLHAMETYLDDRL